MNYGQLKTLVESYAHRTDLTSLLDNFCELAEARIGRKLRAIENEHTETVTTTDEAYALSGLTYLYGSMLSIFATISGNRRPLTYYTKDQLDNLTSGISYTPYGYTIQANALEVRPVNGNQSLTITYFFRPTTLVGGDSNTNAILTAFPQLYIAAMLYEIASYERDRDEQALQLNAFNTEIMSINEQASDARMSGGTMAANGSIG